MTNAVDDAWEEHFEALFPAYLLPSAACGVIGHDVAERLVQRVMGPDASFAKFRTATFITACRADLAAFASRELPRLCGSLRGRTEVVPQVRRGRLVGRLDVARTLASRLRGDVESISSRVRVRRYDHPAEVFVRAVAARLLAMLAAMRRAWRREPPEWAPEAQAWEFALRHALDRTSLRRVAEIPFGKLELPMLQGQRHPAFALAGALFTAMRDALDSNDPACIARYVSRGALWPLKDWQRFELAVALTLARAIEARLVRDAPQRWAVRHTVIDAQREEIVAFECADGRRIRLFYNQSPLVTGHRGEAIAHYFGRDTASRPDVIVVGEGPGRALRALVVEVKLSDSAEYRHRGFDEALVYSMEYAQHLVQPTGSVLVTRSVLPGKPRSGDHVVALGWRDWQKAEIVIDAVLATVGGRA